VIGTCPINVVTTKFDTGWRAPSKSKQALLHSTSPMRSSDASASSGEDPAEALLSLIRTSLYLNS
jgi:hypothetical protein